MKANVNAEILKITPELAVEWLANRWGEQRSVRNNHVERLVSDMQAGRFRISPDAILRVKGKLANGQHRLEAVVKCGKPQTFLVMESNDEELYKVVDAGLRRTASDGLIGMPYSCHMPPISRWVQAYHNGMFHRSSASGSEAASSKAVTLTQHEIIDYCTDNSAILSEAASFCASLYEKSRLLPISIAGALFVIGAQKNKIEQTMRFLQCVYLDGGENAAGDLRNRLILNRGSKSKLPAGYIFGLGLKALKSFINGSRPAVLKWVKGEPMPTLQ